MTSRSGRRGAKQLLAAWVFPLFAAFPAYGIRWLTGIARFGAPTEGPSFLR